MNNLPHLASVLYRRPTATLPLPKQPSSQIPGLCMPLSDFDTRGSLGLLPGARFPTFYPGGGHHDTMDPVAFDQAKAKVMGLRVAHFSRTKSNVGLNKAVP